MSLQFKLEIVELKNSLPTRVFHLAADNKEGMHILAVTHELRLGNFASDHRYTQLCHLVTRMDLSNVSG